MSTPHTPTPVGHTYADAVAIEKLVAEHAEAVALLRAIDGMKSEPQTAFERRVRDFLTRLGD